MNKLITQGLAVVLLASPPVVLLAGGFAPSPAWAWDYNQTGGNRNQQIGDGATGTQNNNSASASARSAARSNSSSRSSSGASSASSGNSNSATSNTTITGGLGSGGGNALGIYVPDGAGQAPCGGGLGLSGLGLGGGGSGGGTLWEFGDCKRIREAAMLRAMRVETGDGRLEQAALNELCQIDRIREAFGGKCPDLGGREGGEALLTQAHRPDYCFTRNAGDKDQHLECNRTISETRSVRPVGQ